MSKLYSCRPSEIMGIEDDYTAFCFDEACAYICSMLLSGEKPNYNKNTMKKDTHYKSFTSFYADFK